MAATGKSTSADPVEFTFQALVAIEKQRAKDWQSEEKDAQMIINCGHLNNDNILMELLNKHAEDRKKHQLRTIDKLRMNHATLLTEMKRYRMKLDEKAEMGEVVHEIDFRKLVLEGEDLDSSISDKNEEIRKLKQDYWDKIRILESLRIRLARISREQNPCYGKKLQPPTSPVYASRIKH